MKRHRKPAPRDQEASPFGAILEGFWRAHPSVLAAAFVDDEGECIDYFSTLEPFEAKVAGAHLVATSAILRDNFERAGLVRPRLWIIEAEQRDFVMARASEEYMVILVLDARGLTARMLQAVDSLIEALGREAGIAMEHGRRVEVDLGRDQEGRPLPLAVHTETGCVPVLRVLGRWYEQGALSERRAICYRLALPDREITLVHDRSLDSWQIRRGATDSLRPTDRNPTG